MRRVLETLYVSVKSCTRQMKNLTSGQLTLAKEHGQLPEALLGSMQGKQQVQGSLAHGRASQRRLLKDLSEINLLLKPLGH